jgi:hypothetical protein
MKNLIRKFSGISVLLLASASLSFAATPPLGTVFQGEARFCSVATANAAYCAENVFVDFQVVPIIGGWEYRYQIENVSSRFLGRFTLELPFIGAFNLGVGFYPGADLDSAPYNHTVVGERAEPANCCVDPLLAFQSLVEAKAEYSFPVDNIPPSWESTVLFGRSTLPPAFGRGFIQDTIQFNNQFAPSEFIPVPVPEPASMILMGAGLLAVGIYSRRRGTV